MQDYVESKECKSLFNSKNIDGLIELYHGVGIDIFVKMVKLTRCLVNPYGGDNRYQNTIDQLDSRLYEELESQEYKKWENVLIESKLLNECYESFYNMSSKSMVKSIDPKLEISSFLMILEKFLFFCYHGFQEHEHIINKSGLKFNIRLVDDRSNTQRIKFQNVYDLASMSAHEVLAFLLFYKDNLIYRDIVDTVTTDSLNQAFCHLGDINIQNILNEIEKGWRCGGRSLKRDKDGNIVSTFTKNSLCKDTFIAINRRENRKTLLMIDAAMAEGGKLLSLGNEKIDFERYTPMMLEEYFFSYDENSQCNIGDHSIELGILLKGYFILKKICMDFIQAEQDISSNEFSKVCVVLSEKSLKQRLLEDGITEEKLDNLIEIYTFSRNTDLFDSPLIKISDKYVLIPNLVQQADIPQVILSKVDQCNFLGGKFENKIIKLLNERGLEAHSLQYKDKKEIYQCDLAFCVGDDLFICECKAWGLIRDEIGFYEQLNKCYDAKKQLDRIADKYIEEMDYLKKQFNRDKDFRNIEKVVITANPLGVNNTIDGTYFTDYSALSRFITRNKPGIRASNPNISYAWKFGKLHEYDGPITYNKFIIFLKKSAQISAMLKNTELVQGTIHLDNLLVKCEAFTKKVQDFDYNDPREFLSRNKYLYHIKV